MKEERFDNELEQLISREKQHEGNPFVQTRILQHIEGRLAGTKPEKTPVWARVLQPVVVSAALIAGIMIGHYTATPENPESSAQNQEVHQQLKSDLFISDITMEDHVLTLNETP
jgi:hypothetical protein